MIGGSLCDSSIFCGYTAVTTLAWEDTAISDLFINEKIRDREVRVIGEDGAQLGVMQTADAMKLAQEAEARKQQSQIADADLEANSLFNQAISSDAPV